MNEAAIGILRQLVTGQRLASLGTLHQGEPYVSMVPVAPLPDGSGFVVHVSGLSVHTRDMNENPRVSLLLRGEENDAASAQAVPRVTIQADAERLGEDTTEWAAAREAYLSRFPEAEGIFELGDFSLFVIRPISFRIIGGFAQATTVGPEALKAAMEAS